MPNRWRAGGVPRRPSSSRPTWRRCGTGSSRRRWTSSPVPTRACRSSSSWRCRERPGSSPITAQQGCPTSRARSMGCARASPAPLTLSRCRFSYMFTQSLTVKATMVTCPSCRRFASRVTNCRSRSTAKLRNSAACSSVVSTSDSFAWWGWRWQCAPLGWPPAPDHQLVPRPRWFPQTRRRWQAWLVRLSPVPCPHLMSRAFSPFVVRQHGLQRCGAPPWCGAPPVPRGAPEHGPHVSISPNVTTGWGARLPGPAGGDRP